MTTSIGQLPLEVLETILDLVVMNVGVSGAAVLRGVNRVFADRLLASLERLGFLRQHPQLTAMQFNIKGNHRRKSASVTSFLARFLLRRPLDQSQWDMNVSSLLNHLLDALLSDAADLTARFIAMEKLCRQIYECFWSSPLLYPGVPWMTEEWQLSLVMRPYGPWEHHLLAAAIVLGRTDVWRSLVDELIPSVAEVSDVDSQSDLDDPSEVYSNYLGSPLFAAAAALQLDTVEFLQSRGFNAWADLCPVLSPVVLSYPSIDEDESRGDYLQSRDIGSTNRVNATHNLVLALTDSLLSLPPVDSPRSAHNNDLTAGPNEVETSIILAIQERNPVLALHMLAKETVRAESLPILVTCGIRWAVYHGYSGVVSALCRVGRESTGTLTTFFDILTRNENTPYLGSPSLLSVAAWRGNTDMMRFLIRSGVQLRTTLSRDGDHGFGEMTGGVYEALLAALTDDQLDAVDVLLDDDIRSLVFLPQESRDRLIVHAMSYNSSRCALRLVSDPSFYAGAARLLPFVHRVAKKVAERGTYPPPELLHMACRLGCVEVARYLLDLGVSATCSLPGLEFHSPLEATLTAPADAIPKLEELLVAHGASPIAKDDPLRESPRSTFRVAEEPHLVPGRWKSMMPRGVLGSHSGKVFSRRNGGLWNHYVTFDGMPYGRRSAPDLG